MSMILVTGANRGIGLEFTRQYAEAGHTVIATCRLPDKASDLAELSTEFPAVTVKPLDLRSDSSIESLHKYLKNQKIRLDVLISNAGILLNERFHDWQRNSFLNTLNTNAVGPAILVQTLDSVLSSSAKVVQISSGLGSLERGGKGMSDGDSYVMSKAALNMLTVRLTSAYEGSQRTVVSLSPGWVATDMGGAGADLRVEESVSRMIPTIKALTPSDSGRFIDNQGNTLPW